MNKELIREKLSNTIDSIEELKTILVSSLEHKNLFDIDLDKLITKIRMNTLACLIQMSETDDLSGLSPDEQELYYEYESEGEKESNSVGVTSDGFYYLT